MQGRTGPSSVSLVARESDFAPPHPIELAIVFLILPDRPELARSKEKGRTSIVSSKRSVLTMKPFVHARSDGEWPAPTHRTVCFSLRASSTINTHSSSVEGRNTVRSMHERYEQAMEVKKGCKDDEGVRSSS